MSTRLNNEFTVPVPVERAWAVLLDVERIAPCMPGATLDSVEGDTFTGRVKVKVGPITVTYRGEARFTGKDEAARVVGITANGKEARGTGTASADVTATLREEGSATRVTVQTDLNVTGRVAQFGRGVMADVSAKLVDKFAANLAAELERDTAEGGAGAAESGEEAAKGGEGSEAGAVEAAEAVPVAQDAQAPGPVPTPRPAPGPPPVAPRSPAAGHREDGESLDLLDIAGGPALKRALPAIAFAAALLLLLRQILKHRRKGRRG
ncbi:carbon monoxide dehydrogenase subunit G [Spinactinospora alkalitolerans]|uniref:Carbon monoxide dehydrogenase subunit G n=1 Tax=Spinactinospora alkalitolerans TaxID=687207 RepID=A0A852U2N2_9ACTN|nr:SRPBCC family protein [Spinactinospora alkalitolerans]NYE49775.1 carbon monoxide dehydrogenase subunit G [Spinactinospora alkalitolerans]